MTTIAVQTAVGEIGSKATTELSFAFNSLLNLGEIQIGTNSDGIYLLNTDDDESFERTFTLATTDLGIPNPKHARFFHIGIVTDNDFVISVKFDNSAWRNYAVEALKNGLQRIRVPLRQDDQGRYFTLKITSNYWFRIDSIDGDFIIRSNGIGGY